MPRSLTQCNCTVCRKYGVLWAYYRRKQVAITAPRGTLKAYSVRRGGLRFVHCTRCGCLTSWQLPSRDADARIALNARLFEHARIAEIPISVLDGDKTWRVVEQYRRPAMFISPSR